MDTQMIDRLIIDYLNTKFADDNVDQSLKMVVKQYTIDKQSNLFVDFEYYRDDLVFAGYGSETIPMLKLIAFAYNKISSK